MWNSLSNISFYENLLQRKNGGATAVTDVEVNFDKLCRTCLRDAPDTNNLMQDFEIGAINFNMGGKALKLIDMMKTSTRMEISEYDALPHQVCNNCIQNISGAYFFRLRCQKAENVLHKLREAFCSPEEKYHTREELDSYEDSTQVGEIEDMEAEDSRLLDMSYEDYKGDSEVEQSDSDQLDISTDDTTTVNCNEQSNAVQNIQIEIINDDDLKSMTETKQSPDIKCSECGAQFVKKKDLNDHCRLQHPNAKLYKCGVCEAVFSKPQSLKRHEKIHQENQKNKLCTYCGKRFARADDLKRHVRTHTGEKPYACTFCPKRYKQTSELKEHLDTHSKTKSFKCTICGKCLFTRNGYYVHMKVHQGVKNHHCSMCGNKYVTSGELASHIRHIHDKSRPFNCNFENCERTFTTKLSLDVHKRSHTGERPFECSICGKKLASASSLSEHKRIHTGENRQTCEICKKTVKNLQALKKHMRSHPTEITCKDKSSLIDPTSNEPYETLISKEQFTIVEMDHADVDTSTEEGGHRLSTIRLIVDGEKVDQFIVDMDETEGNVKYAGDTIQYLES